MAFNLRRAIESRWKINCASLSAVEIEVILWSIIIIIIIIIKLTCSFFPAVVVKYG